MNIFFWLLVIAAAIILWFALRRFFTCTGKYINRVLNDTKIILKTEETTDNETTDNTEVKEIK